MPYLNQLTVHWHQAQWAGWLYSCFIGMKSKEGRENQCQFYCFQPPSFGLLWHPRSLTRLESQGWTEVGSKQPGRVPFIEPLFSYYYFFWMPLKITTVCLSQLRPESQVGSKPGGSWQQQWPSLHIPCCWGSQLKPLSWERSLLAPKYPQLGAVAVVGVSLVVGCVKL